MYCWEVFLEDALLPILQKDGLLDRHGRSIIKITVVPYLLLNADSVAETLNLVSDLKP